MAKYTINYKCGCEGKVELFGKYADRYSRIAYLETTECPECYRAKANAAASAAKEERGLTDLTGSEKQVAWANSIREGAYKALDCLMPYAQTDEAKKLVESWRDRMNSQTTAKWWIDKRYSMPKAFKGGRYSDKAYLESAAAELVTEFRNLLNDWD